jgi:hypothetical protein
MRVLICGDRHWTERYPIFSLINRLEPDAIIEGCASGADRMAEEIAADFDIVLHHFPAQWQVYGRAAGPIRNQRMLDDGKPDLVVAYHDDIARSRGTKDMLDRARKARLPVLHYAEGTYHFDFDTEAADNAFLLGFALGRLAHPDRTYSDP